ncbi:MAG: cupin domain-containing protein [bacterium]|nr:cupin domain-containing protein [bacterium]
MNLVALAQRIGRLRKERRLTLQQVADAAGLTRSMLSKIENFRITPSLPALGSIAAALGVTTAELLDGLDDKPDVVVLRENERMLIQRDYPQSNLVYQALAHTRPQKLMEPFIVEVPAGDMNRDRLPHEGEEFFIVLQGKIDYEYNDEIFHLQEGDAVYADGNIKHRLVNTGTLPARVLIIFARQQ